MLSVNNLVVKYGEFTAVKNISFNVNKGEIFGVLGTNGAGKSTIFRTAIGLIEPFSGEVLYNGVPISYDNIDEVGYMIEERSLLPKYKVVELAMYFGKLKSLDSKTIEDRLNFWLDFFSIPHYKNEKIKKLSKGNQQKIQFIISVLNNPKLLILDEPFSGLDPVNMLSFVNAINELRKKDTMIIFSSHQLEMVEQFCENIIVMEKGDAIIRGAIKEIKKDFPVRKVRVSADNIDIDYIKNITSVLEVESNNDHVIIHIENEDVIPVLFDYIKGLKNVLTFDVEYATLTEIFVAKVGGKREEA